MPRTSVPTARAGRPRGARTRNSPMRMLLLSLRGMGVALLALTTATGCGSNTSTSSGVRQASGGDKRIIIMTNGNSPFWDACRVGLQEAEKDLGLNAAGFRAVLEVNDGTP